MAPKANGSRRPTQRYGNYGTQGVAMDSALLKRQEILLSHQGRMEATVFVTSETQYHSPEKTEPP